jgi:hypothetical protein
MPVSVKESPDVLSRALEILPSSRDEVILSGIVSKITERVVELKNFEKKLIAKYISIKELEKRIEREGIPPGDHALYNDLLEWRAIKHELEELTSLLETI